MSTSFVLTAGLEDENMRNFVRRFKELQNQDFTKEHVPSKNCLKNMWLIKPVNLNQGRGIEMFSALEEVKIFLSRQAFNTEFLGK